MVPPHVEMLTREISMCPSVYLRGEVEGIGIESKWYHLLVRG